ncbi:hypothetical protein D3C86_1137210 [compost metagenome]
MRHLRQLGDDRFAADGLAEAKRELLAGLGVIRRFDQFAQINRLTHGVRQFDADDIAAGHNGDTCRKRRHGAGDIVREADDARGLDAGGGLELIQRDDRARADIDDLALDAEILQHAFEKSGALLQRFRRHGRGLLDAGFLQKIDGGVFIFAFGKDRRFAEHRLRGLDGRARREARLGRNFLHRLNLLHRSLCLDNHRRLRHQRRRDFRFNDLNGGRDGGMMHTDFAVKPDRGTAGHGDNRRLGRKYDRSGGGRCKGDRRDDSRCRDRICKNGTRGRRDALADTARQIKRHHFPEQLIRQMGGESRNDGLRCGGLNCIDGGLDGWRLNRREYLLRRRFCGYGDLRLNRHPGSGSRLFRLLAGKLQPQFIGQRPGTPGIRRLRQKWHARRHHALLRRLYVRLGDRSNLLLHNLLLLHRFRLHYFRRSHNRDFLFRNIGCLDRHTPVKGALRRAGETHIRTENKSILPARHFGTAFYGVGCADIGIRPGCRPLHRRRLLTGNRLAAGMTSLLAPLPYAIGRILESGSGEAHGSVHTHHKRTYFGLPEIKNKG